MKKKQVEEEEEEELQFDKDGLPIPKEESEDVETFKFPEEEKKPKTSILKRIFDTSSIKIRKERMPVTFNVGLSIILFFCYLSIFFVIVPNEPIILLVLLPTLYILAHHIKLEREQFGEKYGQ